MSAIIIDGKALAGKIKDEVRAKISELKGDRPGLAVILVGDDPASSVYVNNKAKDCTDSGIYSEVHRLPNTARQEEVIALIDRLNLEPKINGILVQLPIPEHLDEDLITNRVSPLKDVDGFTYESAGRLFTGANGLVACTPSGCIEMIKSTGYEIKGKNAVVIGRSNIVGKPMAVLLLRENATVTICHSKTTNLKEICSKADILIAAIGRAGFVKADMVKEGAMVIDVGINKGSDGKLTGDVDFVPVSQKAGYITPVPGGVGPMTRAMLMKNTLQAYFLQKRTKNEK